jgi:cytochrome c-type biogenesis protein CcmF
LMPWLAATAFLHSVMIQEKRGMLKLWNVLLVILAFALSLFGTFLTRSGILDSIHSFTESSIGPWFLGFIGLVAAASIVVVLARLPLLRSRTRLESLVSREATFLYNNLLLVALCLTILWGVVWPILTEAVRGESSVVAGPYYNFFLRVFGLPLLVLMGIAPLIAWRRASLRSVGGAFAWPAAAAALVAVALLAAGAGSSPAGLLAYTFSAFVLGSIAYEFVRGTRARRVLSGESLPAALAALVARNRRRYGGYVVHAAIVLLAIGVAGSSAYDTERGARLAVGDSLAVGDYRLTYRGTIERESQNARELRALVDVERDGQALGRYEPGKNFYPVEQQVSSEPAIRSDRLTLEDLFVILDQAYRDGSVQLKAFTKPLVNLIWIAGFVFLGGALIALWPDPLEERRLQERYALQPA